MKIDDEGFKIRALKVANRIIRTFDVGSILIKVALNRWGWNNISRVSGGGQLGNCPLIFLR